jgi:hypothetical protein
MDRTVFDVIREQIKSELKPIKASICARAAKNFEEYSGLCGKIAGLEEALRIVDELERRQIDD